MIPPLPQVDPVPLPAPSWLLWALLTLTFVLHLLPMNLVLGGSIIGAVARARARRTAHAAPLAALVARWLPVLVAATVTFGVAALLFLQVLYGRLFFTAAVLMAVPWLSIVPVLILLYYGTYAARPTTARPLPAAWLLWTVALGFAAIAFVYSNVMGLVLRPEEFAARFQATASGLQLGFSDPTLIARFLHMLLGALAVSGLAVALAGEQARRRDPEFGVWAARQGVYWCAAATILNFLPGFWWLAALPREVLLGFMGQDPLATTWFVLGVLAALAALALLVPAAFAPEPGKLLYGATAGLVLSLVFMVLVRDAAREMTLAQIGFRSTPWVEPQWVPIGIFVVLLVAALACVVWMVVALAKGSAAKPTMAVQG